jgi:AcrR family transcriptional regulator
MTALPAAREHRAEEKRETILMAAQELFMQNGYATTSMDAIADHAGVSKQTIYAHFQNKENLFLGMMEGMCGRFGCPMEKAEADHANAPLPDLMHAVGLQLLRLITRPEAMGLIRLVISESPRNPELGRIFYEQGPAQSHTRLAEHLRDRSQKGEVTVPDPEHAAGVFFAAVYDPLHMKTMMGIPVDVSEPALSAHVAEVVSRFMRAYAV